MKNYSINQFNKWYANRAPADVVKEARKELIWMAKVKKNAEPQLLQEIAQYESDLIRLINKGAH